MRHSRDRERAIACSETFEGNTNHEVDFHSRKASEHRAKAAKARKGGLFSGPNESLAATHDKLAEEHEAKEHDPHYHEQEAAHHRSEEDRHNKLAEEYAAKWIRNPLTHNPLRDNTSYSREYELAARKHKQQAEHHERKAREYQRDQIGRFA
jgi:hypothetical protein